MWSPNGWDHGSGVPGRDGLENRLLSWKLAGELVFSGEVGLEKCAAYNGIGHVGAILRNGGRVKACFPPQGWGAAGRETGGRRGGPKREVRRATQAQTRGSK